MSKESNCVEKNLQAMESAALDIAKNLNWFTPTRAEDVPGKPGWKRIVRDPRVLPDSKEHQIHIDNGMGFAVAQVCFNKPNRIFNVFLKAMDCAGLTPENYDSFAAEFRSFCDRFHFEFEEVPHDPQEDESGEDNI